MKDDSFGWAREVASQDFSKVFFCTAGPDVQNPQVTVWRVRTPARPGVPMPVGLVPLLLLVFIARRSLSWHFLYRISPLPWTRWLSSYY